MCKCCENIEFLKQCTNERKILEVKTELKARLTLISKRKGTRTPCGVSNFKSYDLNYCPMCGRKLTK